MAEPFHDDRRDAAEPRGGGAVGLLAFLLGLALVVVLTIALFLVLNDGNATSAIPDLPRGAEAPVGGR